MTLDPHIARRRALARLALFWERVWPALVPAVCILGLFVAIALMGLPTLFPGWLHLILLLVFAGAFAAALLIGIRRIRLPETTAAERRLERNSDLANQPLGALQDRIADPSDPASRALWEEHKRRLLAQMDNLSVDWPHPGVPKRDPWGLRAVVVLLLAVGIAAGLNDGPTRIAKALTPDLSGPPPPPAQLEAWINPPTYTGLAPTRLLADTPTPVKVPQGSVLLARLFGGAGPADLRIDAETTAFERVDPENQQIELTIDQGRQISLRQGESDIGSWPIDVVIDAEPRITLADSPQITVRNALQLSYMAHDDYGLMEVGAELRLADPASTMTADEVLRLPLPLSPPGAKQAQDQGFHDLTPHPWAGLPVVMVLVATDNADQEGFSEEVELVLPEREFNHPVAKAIIEQRRTLTRQPERRGLVARALSAITAAPTAYDDDVVVHLALRTAASRLTQRPDRPAIAEVQELLWDTALHLEDGKMSLAERELRQAQQELMEALARNADDREIERLMDKLQQAMDRYLQAMAENLQRQMQQGAELQQIDPNTRMVEADELRRMLDRARELSRMGARDAAREMLQQLQQMLENLQGGAMTAMSPEMQQSQQAMRQLGDLMQRQQRLLDQTFRRSPRQPGEGQQRPGRRPGDPSQQQPGQQGQPGEGSQPGDFGGLAGQQEALRRQLGEMMRSMGEAMGEIPGGMGRAERFMRDARRALEQGAGESAVTAQTEALDQLAESMRDMADRMQQQAGQGQPGQNQNGMRDVDPLGRPLEDGGVDTGRVQIPEDWELQRAREILNELRRRAGQAGRPPEERQYIDRLLRQF